MGARSTLAELVHAKRGDILRIAHEHGASNVRLFGSVARADALPTSDIDLLVSLAPGSSLLDHVALWQALEDLLGCRVDVVNDAGLNPRLRAHIEAEARPL